jgi:heme oxygenase
MHSSEPALSRTQRLKAATHDTHDALDQRIMTHRPFASHGHYRRFLQAQYLFLRDADALYDNPGLAALFADLAQRRRHAQIAADLHDLGCPLPAASLAPPIDNQLDVATAMGWLYVVEGSKLGAAILLKMAQALGLSEEKGARHLGGHPDGRARHWRDFTRTLDALTLDASAEARVSAGAKAAFTLMNQHLDRVYG